MAALQIEPHRVLLSRNAAPLQGPASSYALRRTFGQPGEPRVKLYRDHAAWCPCERPAAACAAAAWCFMRSCCCLPLDAACNSHCTSFRQ
jgi:hypothetical protein